MVRLSSWEYLLLGPPEKGDCNQDHIWVLAREPCRIMCDLPLPPRSPALVWGTLRLLSGEKAMADLVLGLLRAAPPSAQP